MVSMQFHTTLKILYFLRADRDREIIDMQFGTQILRSRTCRGQTKANRWSACGLGPKYRDNVPPEGRPRTQDGQHAI